MHTQWYNNKFTFRVVSPSGETRTKCNWKKIKIKGINKFGLLLLLSTITSFFLFFFCSYPQLLLLFSCPPLLSFSSFPLLLFKFFSLCIERWNLNMYIYFFLFSQWYCLLLFFLFRSFGVSTVAGQHIRGDPLTQKRGPPYLLFLLPIRVG
jgi:hypothetical protein